MFLMLLTLACSPSPEAAKPEAKSAPHGKEAAEAAPKAEAAPHAAAPAPESPKVDNSKPIDVSAINPVTTASGLKYWVVQEGTGAAPQSGQTVEVNYTGYLKSDGTKFDSSLDRGRPFSFPLGAGRVIPGWDEGVATMKAGGKTQFEIPASLAYGERGAGGVIPPGAVLIFDVELLGAK